MSDIAVTTETPRNEAGQFESSERAFGREGLNRAAGYEPWRDESKEQPEEITKEDAAQRLKELSGPEREIRTFTSGLEDHVNFDTPEDAAKFLAQSRTVEREQLKLDIEDDKARQQKEIDELRGVTPADAPAPQVDAEDEVQRALKSPKIREAIDARVAEADAQRVHHEAAVAQATNFAVASLFGDFPELADLAPANWGDVIQTMPQSRAQSLVGKLQALNRVQAANEQVAQQKAEREQVEMREYTARERARYIDLIKDIPAQRQAEIQAHLPKMFAEHGVDMNQFLDAIGNQTKFPRSVAQLFLVKAVQHDLMMKAPKPVAARGAVPYVQKPGSGAPRGSSRGDASLAALSAKLNQSGSLKDAAALLAARRSKGR